MLDGVVIDDTGLFNENVVKKALEEYDELLTSGKTVGGPEQVIHQPEPEETSVEGEVRFHTEGAVDFGGETLWDETHYLLESEVLESVSGPYDDTVMSLVTALRPDAEAHQPTLADPVRDALLAGDWVLATELAMRLGNRDENSLSNMIFFAKHPEHPRRKIRRGETEAARKWIAVRNTIVRPVLSGHSQSREPKLGPGAQGPRRSRGIAVSRR
jgi:hypothetical protein